MPGDIAEQTTDSLTIIKQTLEAAGSTLHDLLKVQVKITATFSLRNDAG